MSVHIYTAPGQPLTRHNAMLGIDERALWCRINPRAQYRCVTCGALRWARNLRIKVYYDSSHIFCAEGHEHERGDGRRRLVHRTPHSQFHNTEKP